MTTDKDPQFYAIQHHGEDAARLAPPIFGRYYHGMSQRGAGALVCYQGWGEFAGGDGRVVDMTRYDYLVEHPPRLEK